MANGGLWTFPVRFTRRRLNSHFYFSQLPALALKCLNVFQANLPNLRRLFVEARTEVEENEYSRTAFYNLVLFISSVAIFSLTAQRMSGTKASR
ncbi:hypothetical protein N7490_011845 [Penicillium lividum]|nr:hypothetical protein N7490_011845 [Penicillium lividum]